MAHPMRKHSRGRRDKRRANWKSVAPSLSKCAQCGKMIVPHRVCGYCGYYRGRQVIVVAEKKAKKKAAQAA